MKLAFEGFQLEILGHLFKSRDSFSNVSTPTRLEHYFMIPFALGKSMGVETEGVLGADRPVFRHCHC